LTASVLWGLTYAINEQLYKKISIITSLGITSLLTAIIMFLVAYQGGFLSREPVLIAESKQILRLMAAEKIVLILAEIFIGLSITGKNASLAGIIEISYPVFIVLFSYLLFKESQVNLSTVAGGILIFGGIFIIYYFNK
jgi:drug/metabolite transporter (DMT)-like permease